MQIIKEVCVDSFNDAINAEKNGANRIELCGRLDLDGLTPSKKLISKVFSNLKIPIRVMIRPKHPSFVYSDDEILQMLEDITYCKELGVDGVVLGCLNENSYLDIEKIDLLSKIAKPLNVIIHKAIDSTESVIDSILLLLKNENINGVLTSGGQQFAKDSIEIICAGGVTYENFNKLHSLVKGKYYHGKKIIKFK
jgi:copper homeostasis protein